jgi:hypothetical protein
MPQEAPFDIIGNVKVNQAGQMGHSDGGVAVMVRRDAGQGSVVENPQMVHTAERTHGMWIEMDVPGAVANLSICAAYTQPVSTVGRAMCGQEKCRDGDPERCTDPRCTKNHEWDMVECLSQARQRAEEGRVVVMAGDWNADVTRIQDEGGRLKRGTLAGAQYRWRRIRDALSVVVPSEGEAGRQVQHGEGMVGKPAKEGQLRLVNGEGCLVQATRVATWKEADGTVKTSETTIDLAVHVHDDLHTVRNVKVLTPEAGVSLADHRILTFEVHIRRRRQGVELGNRLPLNVVRETMRRDRLPVEVAPTQAEKDSAVHRK